MMYRGAGASARHSPGHVLYTGARLKLSLAEIA